jgi:hypothetical protein
LWLSIVLTSALGTQGCATAIFPALSALGSALNLASWTNTHAKNGPPHSVRQSDFASAEAESYRQGIRDTLEKLQRSGGLPVVASPRPLENLYYVGPVMQEVWMPAQVVGGMLIPAHRQWVVVRPGTWQAPGTSGRPVPVPAAAHPESKQGPF